ncbi:MAG: hypothetical protein HY738_05915 [Bacteroidia bacterium]|nr:hypothetical protein [Bacteroidia bacterium]
MELLKKIINNNRALFDDSEPENGHFNRFENKLKAYHRRKMVLSIPFLLKTAAVLLLLVMSSYLTYKYFITGNDITNFNRITVGDISPEYQEMEIYYTSLVNQQFEQINRLFIDDSTEKKIVIRELSEMDEMLNSLTDELNTNPNDERIISTIIEYYQLKIEILNRIIYHLKNVKPLNKSSHEKIEI